MCVCVERTNASQIGAGCGAPTKTETVFDDGEPDSYGRCDAPEGTPPHYLAPYL